MSTNINPTNQVLRVAVVGDPHFFVESSIGAQSVSHIKLMPDGTFKETKKYANPWIDLKELTQSEALSADLLLCVGDITTHANAVALKSAWGQLLDLGDQLDAMHIASATGNHDVASRGSLKEVQENPIRWLSEVKGAVEELKLLDPPYPVVERQAGTRISNRHIRTRYFGDAIALVETARYRLLVLNSCCEHSLEPHQYERGTFPQSAQNALREVLRESGHDEKINLLVCHHPPILHSENQLGAHDIIENGEALVRCLEEHGAWLVIHGHK
ncbi:metallophosphoesterase family protein, partial [Achromobacter sp. 413638]|uniref:metallophosphoesterase family protein n=1 Tax=Achromobacter sp. 413638 TaxID=3342385 RepID=UPI003709E956